MNRVEKLFQQKREAGKKSLILYLTSGFPNLELTEMLLPKLGEWGCDLIELGVPFSDPVADGPTIQYSSAQALEAGTSVRGILEVLKRARQKTETPIILFSALNPFLRYGLESIIKDGKANGADGFLVPDLPPEEGAEFAKQCADNDMTLTYLLAPTSTIERQALVANSSTGFIYYISLRGVTGARSEMASDLEEKISEIKSNTDKPVAVGFGVSQPEHVKAVAKYADAVVVGSALISCIREAVESGASNDVILAKTETYVRSLAAELK